MDSYITWPYQIADHYCVITWVYNKNTSLLLVNVRHVPATASHRGLEASSLTVYVKKGLLEVKPEFKIY